MNVNFLPPSLDKNKFKGMYTCTLKEKLCILNQIGKKSSWNGNELKLWTWSFSELKLNTLHLNEVSAINRKKGKMHDYVAHVFLVLIFASLPVIIKY